MLWTYVDSDRCRVFVFFGTVVLKCLQKEIKSKKMMLNSLFSMLK